MRLFYKILLNLSAIISFLVIFFAFQERSLNKSILFKYPKNDKQISDRYSNSTSSHFVYIQNAATVKSDINREYNVWCIFCKATSLSPLTQKFSVFANSLVQHASVSLTLNVVTDNISLPVAEEVLYHVRNTTKMDLKVRFYDVKELAEKISDIVITMQSYFTSQPDSYYSDSLFFLSIGLYRIALDQDQVVMIDVDTKFHVDVKLLFEEFDKFGNETILGIAPEQSPVYRHVLYMYRAKYRDTEFGKPLSQNGNPGVNSGVLLLHLARMRESNLYERLLLPDKVKGLIEKYMFHGHLGDQDWYTLLSQEYKKLIYFLDCTWNRQLCQWWNHHGYKDIFNMFYHCDGKIKSFKFPGQPLLRVEGGKQQKLKKITCMKLPAYGYKSLTSQNTGLCGACEGDGAMIQARYFRCVEHGMKSWRLLRREVANFFGITIIFILLYITPMARPTRKYLE